MSATTKSSLNSKPNSSPTKNSAIKSEPATFNFMSVATSQPINKNSVQNAAKDLKNTQSETNGDYGVKLTTAIAPKPLSNPQIQHPNSKKNS